MPNVVLLGTLDTKAKEYEFVKGELERRNITTTMVDAGVVGSPGVDADVTREEVAAAGGFAHAKLVETADRGLAIEAMSVGATAVVKRLHASGLVDGILGLGGSGGTALVTAAMRALPVGVPKVMVSTVASGDTRSYVGATDITMMYSVVDIAGINRVSRRVLGNAAGAIAGMVAERPCESAASSDRPLIAASMFGVTTPCVQRTRELLEAKGYEVLVFHATGTGGLSMESLVASGLVTAVLDITTTELADELVGGIFSAGPDRLTAAARAGIPQVVSIGALDMVNFGAWDTVPEKFSHRKLYKHNASITLMRTNTQECAELGRRLATRISDGSGPRYVIVPLRGVSLIAVKDGPFYDPVSDAALVSALKANLSSEVTVREVDTDINDPIFAQALVDALLEAISIQ